MRMLTWFAFALFTFAFVPACGGGSATAANDTTADVTDDQPYEADPMDDEETEQARVAPAPTPVQVTLEVKVGDRTVPVEVELVGPDGAPVAVRGGGVVSVLPGEAYNASLSITDEHILIGGSDMHVEVVAPAEAGTTMTVRVPVAQVKLNVRMRGRLLSNPRVTLFREGSEEPVATFRQGNDHIAIRPGRYEADVEAGQNRIRVRGLTFMEDATQNVPVDIQ